MKIFTDNEIRDIENEVLSQGVTWDEIIESTGRSLAKEIASECGTESHIFVFAGNDRCGAYAVEATRHLGAKVRLVLFNIGGNRLSDECRAARDRYIETCGKESLTEVTGKEFSMPEIKKTDTIVDGLFGSERTTPLTGGYKITVQNFNDSGAKIISVDIPSGLTVDVASGIVSRDIAHADVTLAIGVPRLSFLLRECAEMLGRWRVVPVSQYAEAISKARTKFRVVEKSDIQHLLHPRNPFASKADFGDAIIYAGSYGMMGAAVLATRAALRAGAGKVTCHTPRCGYYVMQTSVPCAMTETDRGDVSITQIELRRSFDAVAIGPGIGTADSTIEALDSFLKVSNANSRPVVLDADALNCLSIRPTMLSHVPVMSVLTPHAGEFDRLFGRQPTSSARLLKAIEVAAYHQVIIILKGRHTAIVRPDGKVYFNPTGTPAMATAGSGDVLTGILAGFIAQGLRPELAAIAATYIHGTAGEIAARRHGTYGTTAEDIAEAVGVAIKSTIE